MWLASLRLRREAKSSYTITGRAISSSLTLHGVSAPVIVGVVQAGTSAP